MGLGEVFRGEQTLGAWLTGRDVKEQDLYVDIPKAESTIDEINNIANTVPQAGSAVTAALSTLNSVNGMSLLGGFQLSNLDAAFDAITAQVKNVAGQMEKRVGDAKYYSSSTLDKIFGTATMVGAKIGEGFLGAFEDIGDGVVSVTGWVTGKLGFDNQWAEDLVKKDWSHDAFKGYYESDLAKKSAITEDSALSGACEIAGKAAGYMYAGGMFNGLTGLKSFEAGGKAINATTKLGRGMQHLGSGILKLGSSSTMSATAVAGLGGLGTGTETGLYQGKSFDDAFQQNGLTSGAINAGLAFAGGKWGEHRALTREAKAITGKGATRADIKTTKEFLKEEVAAGRHAVYQGYDDAITQAGERFGTATRNFAGDGASAVNANVRNWFTRGSNPVAKTNAQLAAQNANETFKQSAVELLKQNPVSQLGSSALNGLTNLGNSVKTSAAKGGIRGTTEVAGKIVTAPLRPAVALGKQLATTGGITMAGVAAADEGALGHENAEEQFRVYGKASEDGGDPSKETPKVVGGQLHDPEVPADLLDPQNKSGELLGGDNTPEVSEPVTTQPVTEPVTSPPPDNPAGPGPGGNDNGGGYTPPSSTYQSPTLPPVTTSLPTSTPAPTENYTTPTVTQYNPDTTPILEHTPEVQPEPIGGGHIGAGYTGEAFAAEEAAIAEPGSDAIKTSIDDIIKGNKYSKIPTSSKPIGRVQGESTGSTVIPISAGLSAAAAVGLGAKAYLDKKTKSDEDEEEDIERWQGEGSVDIAPEKVEESPLLNEGEGTLQSRILESVTGESYADL